MLDRRADVDWTPLQRKRKMGKTGRADRGSKRFGYKGGGPPVVFVGLCSPH